MSEENQYIIPNRAVPLTVVESKPINQNWEEIQEAINANYDLASQVENKIDISEKGVEGGVATLDINNKLEAQQIPDEAKGHVYEVNSLTEQLALTAYTGDICVRHDKNKAYALKINSPGNFSSWVEIASTTSGGEVANNFCYNTSFNSSDWQTDFENNRYYLLYDNLEHGQGNSKYLQCYLKNYYGQSIICDYEVDPEGLVTIYSDVIFDGFVSITNLSGNYANLKYIPYSIISGYNLNGVPAFITHSLHSISIITQPNLIIMDGFNIIRTIQGSLETEISTELEDSNNIVFIDSINIVEGVLEKIEFIKSSKYFGVVNELPSNAEEGDRCYVAYDTSYEFSNGGWRTKAFVPVGEFTINSGIVSEVNSYNFNQNGINVNNKSHSLDYLLGSEINGLEISITDNIIVESGKCLGNSTILELNDSITKNYNLDWVEGNAEGCMDSQAHQTSYIYEVTKDSQIYYTEEVGEINSYLEEGHYVYYDVNLSREYKISGKDEFLFNGNRHEDIAISTGWGNVFIIGNNRINKIDLLLSFEETPNLPTGYNEFRRIGYFYRDQNGVINQARRVYDKSYFAENMLITSTITSEMNSVELNLPKNVEAILSYNLPQAQIITFYYDNIEIHEEYNKVGTVTIPTLDNVVYFKGEQESTITFKVLGYLDRRQL